MDPITVGVIGAGLAQGAISSGQSRWNTRKTIEAQREAAELKHARDIEMWQRQNEYNSPAQQMARLQAAGLNPNLVYGSGGVTGNTAGGMPQYQDLKPEYNHLPIMQNAPDVLQQWQDMRMRSVQISNAQKQGNILDQEQKIRAAEATMRHPMLLSKRTLLDYQGSKALSEADLKALQYGYFTDWGAHGTGPGRAPKYSQLMDYQLQSKERDVMLKDRNLALMTKRMALLDIDTALKEKMVDWYEKNTIGKLGIGLMGNLMKLLPVGKAAAKAASMKGISGKFPRFDRWPGTFPEKSSKF